jgi:large subunit ribosomal protein L22
MPNWGYSFTAFDEDRMARASGRELHISPKAAREICHYVQHMSLRQAQVFLERVVAKEQAVPYRRHRKEVSHKRGLQGWYAGRYPVKAARQVLSILGDLEANAEGKGLDIEHLKIVHAAAHRGRVLKRYFPRAFGRSSPNSEMLCHLEFVVEETG